MHNFLKFTLLFQFIVSIFADPYAENSPCPKGRCNNANTGVAVGVVGITSAKMAWTASTFSNALRTSTSTGPNGEALYVGTYSGTLTAIDAHNGTFLWAYANDGAINSCNAAIDAQGTIYVVSKIISIFIVFIYIYIYIYIFI